MQTSNAAPYPGVPFRLTEEFAMKATDLDRQGTRHAGRNATDREWLRVVGVGVGLVLVCARSGPCVAATTG